YAVKILSLNRFSGPLAPGLSVEELRGEAEMLKQLDHPYIVKLEDVFTSDTAVYLVMELLHGGDLFDRIVDRGRYDETSSRRVARRILSAVGYLHERHIVHRDLKPENILLEAKDNDFTVKVTDFGLAKKANKDGLRTFCGTPQYFAPEVLRRRNTVAGVGRYDVAADMWSVGVILYILLSGTPPFDASDSFDAASNAQISFKGSVWSNVSEVAIDMVGRLLDPSPQTRMTVSEACDHEWIAIDDGDTHTHPLRDPAVPKQAVPRSKAAPAKAKPKAAPKPRPPVAPSKPPPKPKPAVKASPAKLKPAPAVVPTSSSKKPAKAKAKPQAPARSTAKSPGSAAILATKNRNLSDDELEDFSDDEDGGFGDANLTKISDVFKRKAVELQKENVANRGGKAPPLPSLSEKGEGAEEEKDAKKRKLQLTLDGRTADVPDDASAGGGAEEPGEEEESTKKAAAAAAATAERKQRTLAEAWGFKG
ncbi:hypothetical protein TeGR_g12175, partial [Tetraparma gracilis]